MPIYSVTMVTLGHCLPCKLVHCTFSRENEEILPGKACANDINRVCTDS